MTTSTVSVSSYNVSRVTSETGSQQPTLVCHLIKNQKSILISCGNSVPRTDKNCYLNQAIVIILKQIALQVSKNLISNIF